MDLTEIVRYLDEYLKIQETPDYPGAVNGLQVEGVAEVERILTAVDASEASVREAAGSDMLIVHHGLFWDGVVPVTGRARRRLGPLLVNEVSLYSAHLPLDAHPEVGNNAVLARMLGLEADGGFGEFKDVVIGVYSDVEMPVVDLASRVGEALGVTPRTIALGPASTTRVAVVSGGGGSAIAQAAAAGVDTIVTGEISHNHYLDAEEHSLNVICAGHYATETVGVKALGEHLAERFGLKHSFFDHPTGM